MISPGGAGEPGLTTATCVRLSECKESTRQHSTSTFFVLRVPSEMRHMFPEERDPWSEIKSPRLNSLSIFIMSCGERLRGWVNLSSEFCIHIMPVSILVFFPFCSNEMCLASNIYTRETISKWRVCPSLSVTGGVQGPGELDEGAPHPGLLSDGRHANRDNHHPHSSVRLQTHMSIFWQNIWSFLLENSFDGKRGISTRKA